MRINELNKTLDMIRELGHDVCMHYLPADGGPKIRAYDIDNLWRYRVKHGNISGPKLIKKDY